MQSDATIDMGVKYLHLLRAIKGLGDKTKDLLTGVTFAFVADLDIFTYQMYLQI